MKVKKHIRRLALLVSVFLLLLSSAQTTFGYIVTETDSIYNIFTASETEFVPPTLTLTGEKILQGRDWQEGDSFSFLLEKQNENGAWEEVAVQTVAYSPEQTGAYSFDFSDSLVFDTVGVFSYRVTEIIGESENIRYDRTEYCFAVTVTETQGTVAVSEVASDRVNVERDSAGYHLFVSFRNVYMPSETPADATVTLFVDKTVNSLGEKTIGANGFTFVLERSGEKQTAISDLNGNASFTLTYTAEDIGNSYRYKLYELDEGAAGVTYDTTVYFVEISVTLGEDQNVLATVTVDGTPTDTFGFTNTYKSEESPVQPGDPSLVFWVVLMILSACSTVTLFAMGRRRR